MQNAAAKAGYDLSTHIAQQVEWVGWYISVFTSQQVHSTHCHEFDFLIAMDRENLSDMKSFFPTETHSKFRLFSEFLTKHDCVDVPDPYYEGGHAGVIKIVEDGVDGIIEQLL